jgi:hypothetical protein
MKYTLRIISALAIAAFAASGCDDEATGPDDRSDGDLVFARFAATAQTHQDTASFWAVKGQDRRLEMDYPDGDHFLEFRVGPGALLLKPGGQPFLNGDSVLITVHADPQQRFIFTFEPSGLTFSPLDPAELRIRYDRADHDVDHDGDTDSKDSQLLLDLQVWQQQAPALPWLPVPTLRVENDSEVRGTVTHFTSFALAS